MFLPNVLLQLPCSFLCFCATQRYKPDKKGGGSFFCRVTSINTTNQAAGPAALNVLD